MDLLGPLNVWSHSIPGDSLRAACQLFELPEEIAKPTFWQAFVHLWRGVSAAEGVAEAVHLGLHAPGIVRIQCCHAAGGRLWSSLLQEAKT